MIEFEEECAGEAIGVLVASFIAVSPEVDFDSDKLAFPGGFELFELLVTRAVVAALQLVPPEVLENFVEKTRSASSAIQLIH